MNQPRIAIDAHMVGARETGNETYVRGVVRGLQELDGSREYLLYTPHPDALPATMIAGRFQPRTIAAAGNIPRIGYAMPHAAWRDRIDLLHVTYTLPPFLRCRSVVTVHDISYALFPETFSLRDRWLLSVAVPLSMRRATRVITVSEAARRDILRRYRIAAEKVVAIPNGVGSHFRPVHDRGEQSRVRARYGIPERYILAVGNLQPRKNLGRLIEAFAGLRRDGRIAHRLVLVGKSLWKEAEVFGAIRAHGLEDEVIATGYVADSDLPTIYSGADVFVYPSLYEGFGLPPVEAMACGAPVITSNTSALPEVVGDAAVTVSPTSTGEIAAALERVLGDERLRRDLRARGEERAATFTWRETARRTLRVYDEVLAGRR